MLGRERFMSRHRRTMIRALAGAGLGMFVPASSATAADMALKAPAFKTIYDWTGFYLGAHAGFGRGTSNAELSDPALSTTHNVFDGMIGGVQAGYNYRLPSGLLLCIEADISFPNYLTSNSVVSSVVTA